MAKNNIERYLTQMVESGASDIFMSVGAPPNFKIEGQTIAAEEPALDPAAMEDIVFAILTDAKRAQFETELETNLILNIAGVGRFRTNIYRQRGEIALVARHVKQRIPSFEELGLPELLEEFITEPRGLVLIVGAAGTGKTTTLAAMVDFRNQHQSGHILTVEDPVEFIHKHRKSVVDQREVGVDTLSYAQALHSALREAPDVLIIGEIRDRNTMQQALHFAETGTLCLATLHASNADQSIERIVNFFPLEFQNRLLHDLSLQLKGIISQRLIEGQHGHRLPAVEIMRNTAHIAELIREGHISDIKRVMRQHGAHGIQTFDESLYTLCLEGKINVRVALKYADSPHDLRLRLNFDSEGFSDTTH
ncbi:MAG: PilT/PilU family type 4a pilus ATPase [Caldilineaceae bacterium]|nr:PilT/PilU family type 4a pilus ATPase [Caldilineaceae bacterium]